MTFLAASMTTLPADELACAAEPISAFDQELRRLNSEVDLLTKGGIIEIAVRNPSVAEYIEHWEGRALQAEAEVSSLRAQVASLQKDRADVLDLLKSDESIINRLRNECERLEKKVDEAREERDRANALFKSDELIIKSIEKELAKRTAELAHWQNGAKCGCRYDNPDDVCDLHSPAVAAEKARADTLARRVKQLKEKVKILEKKLARLE